MVSTNKKTIKRFKMLLLVMYVELYAWAVLGKNIFASNG
jgi:hypothetical protein